VLRRLFWSVYLLRQIAGQKNLPFRPLEDIRREQSRRVRRIIAHAYRHVPFYTDAMRRLGLRPEDFRSAEDLARLPIVEKSDLQRDPEYFRSRAFNDSDCVRLHTSGSSGAPVTLYHDAAALFQNAAHGERERKMMVPVLGRWSGHRETVIVAPVNSSQRLIQQFCQTRAYFPRGMRIRRQYLLLSDSAEHNLAAINQFEPDLLYAYGSSIEMLAAHVRRTGARWHKPKAVLYTSDQLSKETRRWLEGDNGVPVFTVYGAVEALKIAFECGERGGLHVNADLYPVRILTPGGREAAPGETGEVIVSNLVNRATVLLNYRLGDLAAPLETACACGRTLPRISYPVGRVDEIIETASGEFIHPIRFREVMNGIEGIARYQVRQRKDYSVALDVVPAPGAGGEDLRRRVQRGIEEEFAETLHVEVALVSEIRRNANGKTPVVIAYRRPEQLPDAPGSVRP
jgi:phenylacetate-CoA ligase